MGVSDDMILVFQCFKLRNFEDAPLPDHDPRDCKVLHGPQDRVYVYHLSIYVEWCKSALN